MSDISKKFKEIYTVERIKQWRKDHHIDEIEKKMANDPEIIRRQLENLRKFKEEEDMKSNEIHNTLMKREMNIRAMKLKKWYNDLPNEIKQQLYESNASEEFVAIINEMRA